MNYVSFPVYYPSSIASTINLQEANGLEFVQVITKQISGDSCEYIILMRKKQKTEPNHVHGRLF